MRTGPEGRRRTVRGSSCLGELSGVDVAREVQWTPVHMVHFRKGFKEVE